MAIISQKYIFEWNDLENLGDLKRLKLVLENLPDGKIISFLRNSRGNGRNDYNITAVWNSIIAGIVFQHNSIESLRRELLRNSQLRLICGFDPMREPESVVPKPHNYTRFIKNLMKYQCLIDEMFNTLVKQTAEIIPDFGQKMGIDGKAIQTYAKYKKDGYKTRDGRRDIDANFGVKKYKGITKDGKAWEKIKSWFGYELHLIVDTVYELPIAFEVTKASESEIPNAHDLIDTMAEKQPDILKRCQNFSADRGYDDEKLLTKLWRTYQIKPIIDIRNMWKDPDTTKGVSSGENVVYNYKGDVSCVCPKTGEVKSMNYGGFEKDRNGHKHLCPHLHSGVSCVGTADCDVYKKRYIRISSKENPRIFTPLARCSYKWKKEYKKRTAVERVNSRIDNVYCFENHFIKGLSKMKCRLSLAFCVMLAMAVGRIKEKQKISPASLVRA